MKLGLVFFIFQIFEKIGCEKFGSFFGVMSFLKLNKARLDPPAPVPHALGAAKPPLSPPRGLGGPPGRRPRGGGGGACPDCCE